MLPPQSSTPLFLHDALPISFGLLGWRLVGRRRLGLEVLRGRGPPPASAARGRRNAGDLRLAVRADAPRRVKRLAAVHARRSEEHTSELQSQFQLVCRLLLVK